MKKKESAKDRHKGKTSSFRLRTDLTDFLKEASTSERRTRTMIVETALDQYRANGRRK
jgi:predicted transcriptional regulator